MDLVQYYWAGAIWLSYNYANLKGIFYLCYSVDCLLFLCVSFLLFMSLKDVSMWLCFEWHWCPRQISLRGQQSLSLSLTAQRAPPGQTIPEVKVGEPVFYPGYIKGYSSLYWGIIWANPNYNSSNPEALPAGFFLTITTHRGIVWQELKEKFVFFCTLSHIRDNCSSLLMSALAENNRGEGAF